MTLNYDIPPPYEKERNASARMEPLLYDDITRKLTPEGIMHLDHMGKLLTREDLKAYSERLETAAQEYLRMNYM